MLSLVQLATVWWSVMIEVGQLRRWNNNADGEVFLVIGFTEAAGHGDTTVDYIMNGEHHWDDEEWVETYSEVVSD